MSLSSRCKVSKDGKTVCVASNDANSSGLKYRIIELKNAEIPSFSDVSYNTDIPIPTKYQVLELKEGEELETFSQEEVFAKVVVQITQRGRNQRLVFQNVQGINPSRLWLENKSGYRYYLGSSEKLNAWPWVFPGELQISKNGTSGLRICMDRYCQRYFRFEIIHN